MYVHMYHLHVYDAYVTCVLYVQCQRLSSGLTKILEASEQLSVLNEKLEVQKVAVTEKSEACEILLADITAKTTEANEKKELAEKKSVDIEEQNKVIAVEKVCTYIQPLNPNLYISQNVCIVAKSDP